ncbi:hypothetical protein SASPL_136577 [Salvia splendens]|uniref:Uncharacterized protein n=1 Tax=Salvia splendens TaxID=180675 RepID=A0A8X8X026_SALSN|nr:hypothetical protein SASPL_136577 [Salvia splendens]
MIDGLVVVKDLIMSVKEDLAVSGKEFGDSRSFSLHFDVDAGSADREETYCAKLGASSAQLKTALFLLAHLSSKASRPRMPDFNRIEAGWMRLCLVSTANLHPCSLSLPGLSKMADAFIFKWLSCFVFLPYICFGLCMRVCICSITC